MALPGGAQPVHAAVEKTRLREAKRLSIRSRMGWKRQTMEGPVMPDTGPRYSEGQEAPGGGVQCGEAELDQLRFWAQ